MSHIGVAKKLRDTIPGGVILDQYSNPNNPAAHFYSTFGEIAVSLTWGRMAASLPSVIARSGTCSQGDAPPGLDMLQNADSSTRSRRQISAARTLRCSLPVPELEGPSRVLPVLSVRRRRRTASHTLPLSLATLSDPSSAVVKLDSTRSRASDTLVEFRSDD